MTFVHMYMFLILIDHNYTSIHVEYIFRGERENTHENAVQWYIEL